MQDPTPRRTIASYVPSLALEPGARAALVGLGYRVVMAASQGGFDSAGWKPDLRLVDERHLSRLPDETGDRRIPIVTLHGQRPAQATDPRVIGSVERPARIDALYPLIQSALEDHPRRAARAPTRIAARCTHADRRWTANIRALSQFGCLLESGEDIAEGTEMNLLFPLPLGRMISTRARALSRQGDFSGVAFTSASAPSRAAISEFVVRRLATIEPA